MWVLKTLHPYKSLQPYQAQTIKKSLPITNNDLTIMLMKIICKKKTIENLTASYRYLLNNRSIYLKPNN